YTCVHPFSPRDSDVAPPAAIAAARSAELDILLAAKRHAAVAAVAGADIDLGLVKEFHGLPVSQGRGRGNLYVPYIIEKARIFRPFRGLARAARPARRQGRAVRRRS